MQVQINTDHNIQGHDALARQVTAVVEGALSRFRDRVTRIEVHLSDVNGGKTGLDDKRCLLEARLAGLQPIAVSHQAPTVEQAVDGAAEKLKSALDTKIGRMGTS